MSQGWVLPVLKKILSLNEARRVFHGRGKVVEGPKDLALEWYPPVLLAIAYSEDSRKELDEVRNLLLEAAKVDGLVIQDRWVSGPPRLEVIGEVPDKHFIEEDGLKYWVKIKERQNPGLFLASRQSRAWVREHSKGKTVLNLFAFTGAFGVCALKGGAQAVVQVDMKKGPLGTGKDNLSLNELDPSSSDFWAHDILKSKGKIKKRGPWDLVIMDPPTFQKGAWNIEKDLLKLIRALAEWTEQDSKVLLCVHDPFFSSQKASDLMGEGGWELEQSLPLPEGFEERNPEEGLKALIFGRAD